MPHKRAKRSVREQDRKERGADLAPSGGIHGTSISNESVPKSAARILDAARIRAEYRHKRARVQTDEADAHGGMSASNLKPPPPKKRRMNAGPTDTEKGGKALAKGKDHPTSTIEIQPGESLKHFNRRVEGHMRPLVQSAVRASAANERKAKKAAAAAAASSNKNTNKTQQHPRASPSTITRNSSKAHAEDLSPSNAKAHRDDNDDDLPKEFATMSSSTPRRLNDVALAPPELKKLPRGAAKFSLSGGKAKANAGAAKATTGVLSMAQRAMMEVERENAIRRYREMKERKFKEGDRTLLLQSDERVDEG